MRMLPTYLCLLASVFLTWAALSQAGGGGGLRTTHYYQMHTMAPTPLSFKTQGGGGLGGVAYKDRARPPPPPPRASPAVHAARFQFAQVHQCVLAGAPSLNGWGCGCGAL